MKRRLGLTGISTFSLLLVFELAGRVGFFCHHGLSFWTPASHFAYRFYPNLKPIMEDNRFDRVRVLVLGGSALNRGWSDFEVQLHDQLSAMLGREVQIFNTSMPARTSLDGYYKYWFLRQKPFDLIILYNSINELRANNVPDAIWRDDYSHYAWYDEANFYFQHEPLARYWTILPFYFKHLAVVLDRKIIHKGQKVYYNAERTRPDWWRFGATVKTAQPFRHCLEQTITLAHAKHEPVLLMTYAYHIPPDYSLARFEKGQLDYAQSTVKGSPVEIWGLPENVRKGLDVHNKVLREVAQIDGVFFVDQQALLGGHAKDFIDVCHLSPVGMEQFVQNLVGELKQHGFRPQRFSQTVSSQASPTSSSPSHTPLPSAVYAPTPVMLDRAGQKHPFAFENQVVWQESGPGRGAGIYFYDFTTGQGHRVMNISGNREVFPKISGSHIISEVLDRDGRGNIYIFDETTKTQQQLTGRDAIGMHPDISGELAVWTGFRRKGTATTHHHDIFLYDFRAKKEILVTTDDLPYDDLAPAIDGQTVVWQSLHAGQSGIYVCTYDPATGTCPGRRIMADDGGQTFLVGEPDISGNLAVFSKFHMASQEHTIYLYNLTTDHLERLASQPGFQQSPKISGNRVVWQDHRSGSWDVFYCEYDSASQQCPEQRITHDPWTEWQPAISGDRIFWEDYRNTTPAIYMYEIRP